MFRIFWLVFLELNFFLWLACLLVVLHYNVWVCKNLHHYYFFDELNVRNAVLYVLQGHEMLPQRQPLLYRIMLFCSILSSLSLLWFLFLILFHEYFLCRSPNLGAVVDLVVSEVNQRKLLFVLHSDGSFRVWDLLSRSKIFSHAMPVPASTGKDPTLTFIS